MKSRNEGTQWARFPAVVSVMAILAVLLSGSVSQAAERKFVVTLAYSPKAFTADGTAGPPPEGLYNAEEIYKDYFDRINPDIESFVEYWEEISYGDVVITGDVEGWVALPWAIEPNSPEGGAQSSPANYADLYDNIAMLCSPSAMLTHIENMVPLDYSYGAGEPFCDCTVEGNADPGFDHGDCGTMIGRDYNGDAAGWDSSIPLPDFDAVGVNVWTPGERFVDVDEDGLWDGLDEKNDRMCHSVYGCRGICSGMICSDRSGYCVTDADCPGDAFCKRGSLLGAPACGNFCDGTGVPCTGAVSGECDAFGVGTACVSVGCGANETCGDDLVCSDGSGTCTTSANCPPGATCQGAGPRGCDYPGCGDLGGAAVDWDGDGVYRNPDDCVPVPRRGCLQDADCGANGICYVGLGICAPVIYCRSDADCPGAGNSCLVDNHTPPVCDLGRYAYMQLPGVGTVKLPDCCEEGAETIEDYARCNAEGKPIICAIHPNYPNCIPRPEGIVCGEPRYACEYQDVDDDEELDIVEPFEDFMIRWDPEGGYAGGVWVPVDREYVKNNYPGDVPGLLARIDNGYYNPSDMFLNNSVAGTKMMQETSTSMYNPARVPKPGSGKYAAVGEQAWFDSWWWSRYGTPPPPWPGGTTTSPERNSPLMTPFDTLVWVPPSLRTGDTAVSCRWFQANCGGHNGYGWGDAPTGGEPYSLGGDIWAKPILPEAWWGFYDGWVEHDDLASSKYHYEGDKRFGEITSPNHDTVTVLGIEYPAIAGVDLGPHDPNQAGVTPDNFGVAAGPWATKIFGDKGYDAGDVSIVEWLTWRTDGQSRTLGTQWSIENGPYHPYASPSSPHRPSGRCSQSTKVACLVDGACPSGETCVRPTTPMGFADYNLDGMIDQGEVRPVYSENYSVDCDPSPTADDGTHTDYPFNRQRLMEDVVEALDPSVDWDDYVDLNRNSTVSGIVLVPPDSYNDWLLFPTAGDYYPIHTEDTLPALFHDLVVCQDCRDYPSATAYAARQYLRTWESYPDLYDYDVFHDLVENCPMGFWDIMGGPYGDTDLVHPTPVLKDSSGWINAVDLRTVLTPGVETSLTLPPAEFDRDGYFFLENAERPGEAYWLWSAGSGYDWRLPGDGGMLIMSTNAVFNPANPDALAEQQRESPYAFVIVQADGESDLEACSSTGNYGDAGDLWPGSTGATEFNYDTVPAAVWDARNRWTGLDISNVEPDGEGSVRLTLSWTPTNIPGLRFIDPPGGVSVGSDYRVRFEVSDVFGGTTIELYYTADENDVSIIDPPATDSNYIATRYKAAPGTIQTSMDWDLSAVPDGRYHVFAKLIPGAGIGGTEIENTEPSAGRNNVGTGALTVKDVDVSSASDAAARSETWIIECVDPDGEDWEVYSSLTQPEPDSGAAYPYELAKTCPKTESDYPVCDNFKYESVNEAVTFVITEGDTPFNQGDRFVFNTTGVTQASNAVTVKNHQIVEDPVAVIDASPLSGLPPLKVDFDGRDSYDPDGLPLTYRWNFGDGATSTGSPVSHTFDDAGVFTVVLRVTNSVGRFGETAVDINVINNRPSAVIVAKPVSGPEDLTVYFDGSGSDDLETPADELIYQWSFGDGKNANEAGNAGVFITTEHFYSKNEDGEKCTRANPCKFNAALTVTDTGGKSHTATTEIWVGNTNPVPSVSVSRTEGSDPLDIVFNAINSYDADGDDLKITWFWGDGSQDGPYPVTGAPGVTSGDVVHTYRLPTGETSYSFTPTALLTDGFASVTWTGSKITVTEPKAGSSDPRAIFTITPEPPLEVGAEFTADASLSFDRPTGDPNSKIASYSWDFGDGTAVVSGKTVKHTYVEPGTYAIVLEVKDAASPVNKGRTSQTVLVVGELPDDSDDADGNEPPDVVLLANPKEGYEGFTEFSFDGSGSSDPDDDDLTFEWMFGDGESADGAKATHVYAEAGNYTVRLTVTDEHNASAYDTQTIVVKSNVGNRAPQAIIGTGVRSIQAGEKIEFNGQNSYDPDNDVLDFVWKFSQDDVVIDTLTGGVVARTFQSEGAYQVVLTVSDGRGGTDTTQAVNIQVSAKVEAPDSGDDPGTGQTTPDPSYTQRPTSVCGLGMVLSLFGSLAGLSVMRVTRRRTGF